MTDGQPVNNVDFFADNIVPAITGETRGRIEVPFAIVLFVSKKIWEQNFAYVDVIDDIISLIHFRCPASCGFSPPCSARASDFPSGASLQRRLTR